MSDIFDILEELSRSRSFQRAERAGAGVVASAADLGLQIGRYKVFDTLGTGAFGIVLRAFDPILERPRALKIPNPNVLLDDTKRGRFLKDARALARLNEPVAHPNVVRVYDADEFGGICYIAMELCEAGSLADWLSKLPKEAVIPAYWAADLIKQVAGGVQHAHERGIIHRDLKPANILLTRAGADQPEDGQNDEVSHDFPRFCPKVGDFGLAKILGDGDSTGPP